MTSLPLDGTPSPQQTPAGPPSPSSVLKPIQDILLAKKKQEWASWVDQEFNKCKNARSVFERQWHINLAFYKGKHYIAPVSVPGAGFRLVAPKAPPWRVRLTINKVRTAARTECSKLTAQKPIPEVIPATTEDEDYAAARVATQILKSYFNSAEFDRTLRQFVWWGVCTGNAYLKSYWDPFAVDEMAQPEPQPGPIPGMMIPQPPIRGDVCIENISPFHIYVPDLLAEDLELQPYIIHVMTKSPLWVQSRFGFMPQTDAKAALTINESAFFSAGGSNQHLDAVMVKEVWIKPNAHPDFPEGGMLTIINDRVVQCMEQWPWPFKEFPFYKYEGIPTGEFFTESSITDLIPIQKEYNRTKSQMVEIKNMMGKPKLLYAKGSIDPRRISSEPGQGIPYVPGFPPPVVIPGVEVPASMQNELDQLRADFDDISGQHEITRGNTPAQVTSGTAISFLQEQDDSKLAYQVAGIEHAVQKLGRHYLKYAAAFWQEPRLVRIVGKDNDFEAKTWQGSDLRGNTDVRVLSGSALPQSKAAKQALIMELMQMQLIDPQAGLEVMELGGLDKILEDHLIDKRSAQRENMRMAEMGPEYASDLMNPPVGPDGQPMMGPDPMDPNEEIPYDPMTQQPWQPQPPIPVNSWDNHEAHIYFHNQYRKSQAFELLDDATKQMFELHVQMHQMTLGMPQMGAAGMLPPSPDASGQQPQDGAPEEAAEGTPNVQDSQAEDAAEGGVQPPAPTQQQ